MVDGATAAFDWNEPGWRTLAEPPRPPVSAELTKAAQGGWTPMQIVRDWWPTHRGAGRLTLGEYLYYRLYDPASGHGTRADFVGKAAQNAFHAQCMIEAWRAVADDKLLFDAVARGSGIPVPGTVATVAAGPARGAIELKDADAAAAWLRDGAAYPLFMKPVLGIFSLGTMAADSYDRARDVLVAAGQRDLPVAAVAARMAATPSGYLVQRRLVPHPRVAGRDGATASVRMLVLVGPEGPAIETATLKVPGPGNVADNYWRDGSSMASIDIATGAAVRWVTGKGSDAVVDGPDIDGTPARTGMVVPDWERAKRAVLDGAAVMRGFRTQSWDVAPTNDGPVILEVNKGGDLNLGQLASGRGALTPTFREHLRRNGVKGV